VISRTGDADRGRRLKGLSSIPTADMDGIRANRKIAVLPNDYSSAGGIKPDVTHYNGECLMYESVLFGAVISGAIVDRIREVRQRGRLINRDPNMQEPTVRVHVPLNGYNGEIGTVKLLNMKCLARGCARETTWGTWRGSNKVDIGSTQGHAQVKRHWPGLSGRPHSTPTVDSHMDRDALDPSFCNETHALCE
jgi:hypothetical protein